MLFFPLFPVFPVRRMVTDGTVTDAPRRAPARTRSRIPQGTCAMVNVPNGLLDARRGQLHSFASHSIGGDPAVPLIV
ncbi:hypothetical protein ACFO3J_21245 [Streptomyces polygonati]|uniref:Uncharacterized protein n=1 Tax=Streptomyces polygonati TaxID=1617087 RepID=A0ABV8HT61_9ACTN